MGGRAECRRGAPHRWISPTGVVLREDGPTGAPVSDGLPLLHRLTILYLMLPVCIWLAGWFEWWLGLPAVALLGAGLWPALAGSWRISRPRPAVFACTLLALGWVMLTAAGGVFDGGNGDWIEHRATLLDLGRQPWPVFLPDVLADYLSSESNPSARPLLRYYLGWYMAPGLAARLGGTAALNWAVPLWTWLGVALGMVSDGIVDSQFFVKFH